MWALIGLVTLTFDLLIIGSLYACDGLTFCQFWDSYRPSVLELGRGTRQTDKRTDRRTDEHQSPFYNAPFPTGRGIITQLQQFSEGLWRFTSSEAMTHRGIEMCNCVIIVTWRWSDSGLDVLTLWPSPVAAVWKEHMWMSRFCCRASQSQRRWVEMTFDWNDWDVREWTTYSWTAEKVYLWCLWVRHINSNHEALRCRDSQHVPATCVQTKSTAAVQSPGSMRPRRSLTTRWRTIAAGDVVVPPATSSVQRCRSRPCRGEVASRRSSSKSACPRSRRPVDVWKKSTRWQGAAASLGHPDRNISHKIHCVGGHLLFGALSRQKLSTYNTKLCQHTSHVGRTACSVNSPVGYIDTNSHGNRVSYYTEHREGRNGELCVI